MNISFKILHFKTIKSSKLTSICPFGFSISATTKMKKYKKLIAAILKIIKDCKLTLNGVEHILNIKHVADISFGSLSSNSCRLCKHHGNNWHLLNRISANDNEYLRVESTNPNLPLELSYTVDTLHDIEEGLIAYANVVILNILVNIYGVNDNIFNALLSFAESLNEIQVIASLHGLTDDDIHKLEENIDIYFNARPVLFHKNYDITLKEHLILHYPEVFKKNRTDFTVFSSKRFESYNKVIKNLLATSVNYKNIPYSCAKKAMILENCYNIVKPKI
uniref:SAM-dependent methyltransferase n=1 Tax=Strongyloides venezuelensis TaxID=75913 RepID=A0A0K0G3G6_STRVS